jgi:hypothetical protein
MNVAAPMARSRSVKWTCSLPRIGPAINKT